MSVSLNYKVFGEGDPVIILHGLFGTLDNWQTFAKGLAKDYMVFIVDQRDHGKSPHTDQFDYHVLAEDLYNFMNDNWIYKARLIGHSMGGKTAMQFAHDYYDMVDQLVVVDIAPKEYKIGHDRIFEALFSVDLDIITTRKEVYDVLTKYIDDEGIKLFLMKNLRRKKEGGFIWKMNLNLLHKEYENIISSTPKEKVDIDTLFVKGELSNYINKDGVDSINGIFNHVEIANIENAGHWVHAEKPKELLEVITSFFQKDKS